MTDYFYNLNYFCGPKASKVYLIEDAKFLAMAIEYQVEVLCKLALTS
jgi:hypothetical protein